MPIGFISYWMSDLHIVYTGKYVTEPYTYKYIAIIMSAITSLAISFSSSIVTIDIIAKIYSRNFRIFEPLGKNEKKAFADMKKVLLRKKILYSFIFMIIFFIFYGISELVKS